MRWWKRLWGGGTALRSSEDLNAPRLAMPGWSEEDKRGDLRVWRDAQGAVLSLGVVPFLGLPEISNEAALRGYCRDIAGSRHGGLIEVRVVMETHEAVSLVYKRLELPAYIFTGMLLVPGKDTSQVWTVVAGELGTTGVREAAVTAKLINAGKLTIQEYERSWARDPYDPGYRGTDHRVLRFVSDDECYDAEFPDHPLSRIRRVLAVLPDYVIGFKPLN